MENKDLAFGQEDSIERGESGTPVVERTAPGKALVNKPDVKDIKYLIKKKGGGSIELTTEALLALIHGSDTVVVDLDETNEKIEIRLDQDVINILQKALLTPTTAPTDDTLVGIGTGREQIQIYLGDGLELVGNTSPYTLQVTGVKETNNGEVLKSWVGTQDEYDAITTKDAYTQYIIVEE